MKVYWKYYIVPLLYGIIFSWYGSFHSDGKIQLWELVADVNGGYLNEINARSIAALLELFVPFFVFALFFSTYIYRHFCDCSAYFFSRCKSRVAWYCKESIKLFGFTLLNTVLILFGYFLTGMIADKIVWQWNQVFVVIWYVSIYTLWNFQIVLLANILAILLGSAMANVLVFTWQMIMTVALLTVNCRKLTGGNYARLIWNPNAYLVANWYKVYLGKEKIFGVLSASLSFVRGYFLLGALCVVTWIAGAVIIKKVDIIERSRE